MTSKVWCSRSRDTKKIFMKTFSSSFSSFVSETWKDKLSSLWSRTSSSSSSLSQGIKKSPYDKKSQGGLQGEEKKNLWGVLEENTWSKDNQDLDSFKTNVVVYRCVNLMAKNMARVPLRLSLKGKSLDHHPCWDLLQHPSGHGSYTSFSEEVLSFFILTGNAYILAKENNNTVGALENLHPKHVEIISDKQGYIKSYYYKNHHYPVKEGHSLVLHLKTFNPFHQHYGQSPLDPIGSLARLHTAITEQNLSLLENASCPSGALRIRNEGLTPEDKRELRETLDSFREKKNGVLLLSDDMQWQPLGLSPRDMDFYQGKLLSAREICLAFGVPPMCLGIKGDATFSRHEEAFADLWENTLIPLLDTYVQGLSCFFSNLYKEDLRIFYNRGDIHALTFRDKDRWRFVDNLSCLTLNERRHLLGFPPLKGSEGNTRDIPPSS